MQWGGDEKRLGSVLRMVEKTRTTAAKEEGEKQQLVHGRMEEE